MTETRPILRLCTLFQRRDWLFRRRWYAHVTCVQNGEIVSELSQPHGYANYGDCLDSAERYLAFDKLVTRGTDGVTR